jgi:hypothetical protein
VVGGDTDQGKISKRNEIQKIQILFISSFAVWSSATTGPMQAVI